MDIKSILKDKITKNFSLNMKRCIHSSQSEKKMVSIHDLIGIVKLMYKVQINKRFAKKTGDKA